MRTGPVIKLWACAQQTMGLMDSFDEHVVDDEAQDMLSFAKGLSLEGIVSPCPRSWQF